MKGAGGGGDGGWDGGSVEGSYPAKAKYKVVTMQNSQPMIQVDTGRNNLA